MLKLIAIMSLALSFNAFAQNKKMPAKKNMETQDVAEMPKARPTKIERKYGQAGCGLGTYVMGKRGNQILAATTNATSFNQSIGILAGTLNCLDSKTVHLTSRMDQFIMSNKLMVQTDISRGNGESLNVIAKYLGCNMSSEEMGKILKLNYSQIFKDANLTGDITDGILNAVIESTESTQKCHGLV